MRISDWSSDVCSSDLLHAVHLSCRPGDLLDLEQYSVDDPAGLHHEAPGGAAGRRAQQAKGMRRGRVDNAASDEAAEAALEAGRLQIGRASCRERVGPYV